MPQLLNVLEPRLRALRQHFPDTKGVVFYSRGELPPAISEVIEFKKIGSWPAIIWHLVYPLHLLRWMQSQPGLEVLIIRRGVMPNPFLALAFLRRKVRTFSEHHTKRMEEFGSFFRLPRWLIRALFFVDRTLIDSKLDGKISVTAEIAASEGHRNSALVLANPIVDKFETEQNHPVFDGRELRIGMPVSTEHQWHGVDRLIRSVIGWAILLDELTIIVTLFGVDGDTTNPHDRVTVKRVGPRSIRELRRDFQSQHFGVSSLGLSRIGLQEACPLKSRFFVSSRIPFIYAYLDPDIPEFSPVALRVPNDESLIPWEPIEYFLSGTSQGRYDTEWAALQQRMSLEEKSRILARFIEARICAM